MKCPRVPGASLIEKCSLAIEKRECKLWFAPSSISWWAAEKLLFGKTNPIEQKDSTVRQKCHNPYFCPCLSENWNKYAQKCALYNDAQTNVSKTRLFEQQMQLHLAPWVVKLEFYQVEWWTHNAQAGRRVSRQSLSLPGDCTHYTGVVDHWNSKSWCAHQSHLKQSLT